jgi:hypothetical protein
MARRGDGFMEVNRLHEAGVIVSHLARALTDGTRDLGIVPDLIKRLVKDEMWKEYSDPNSGRRYGPFKSFEEFVQTPGPKGGLGTTVKALEGLCGEDPVAVHAIQRACQRPQGRPRKENHDDVKGFPTGNSKAYAHRRLAKDRPDLHAKVLDGTITTNAAMETAGFKQIRRTVWMDNPESAARTLKKYMSEEVLKELRDLL